MRRTSLPLIALLGIACGSQGEPPRTMCDDRPLSEPIVGFPGASGITTSGQGLPLLNGIASSYQQGSATASFTVMNAVTTDGEGRPTGEFFLFLRSAPKLGSIAIVPVTLAQLDDPGFVPSGPFAVYADSYDPVIEDYARWLPGTSGCIAVTSLLGSVVGHVEAYATMSGQWQTKSGASLGQGTGSVTLASPLVDFRSGSSAPEGMAATVTGVRAKPFAAATMDSYQVLNPSQTRLLIVGTQPADTTREIWLSLEGVPQPGDSIAFRAPTLAEARAGRATSPGSFGMIRMLELDNVGQPMVREIWSSTTGWVKFGRLMQNGPLAICGWLEADFEMTTQGVSLAAPGTSLGTTSVAGGELRSRITILAPQDTLIDGAELPPATRIMRLMAPTAESGIACP